MKVALVTAHLSDAAGGLAESVPGLARALNTAEVETHVVGVQDAGAPDAWRAWGPRVHAQRGFGARCFGFAPSLSHVLCSLAPDLVDAQGLWMYPSLASLQWHRRTGQPYLITPRGMLDPWAVRRSAWKKRLVSHLFENQRLHRAVCIRALCIAEAEAIRAYRLTNPIVVVPNGTNLPELPDGLQKDEAPVLLFLGRLHEKKGVAELLEAWQAVVQKGGTGCWTLQVTGWGDPAYVTELKARAAEVERVRFTGPLFGGAKDEALRKASAFVLPSYSEGLPMAVLEAWSYALPVVMTRQCNLPEAFPTAALECKTDPGALAEALRWLLAMPADQLRAMGTAGRRLIEERFVWSQVAHEMKGVYEWVLGGGPPPSCVMTD